MQKIISHASLFHNLDSETIEYLFRVGSVQKYEKNSIVFLESEPAHHFFLILDGRIKISRLDRDGKEVIIAMLSPGNFFGDMALLDGMPRSTDAAADEKSKILAIREEDFYYLLENKPNITIELLIELAHRIRNSDSQIKGLSLLNARGKVASALLRWAQDQGVYYGNDLEIRGFPKQKEMASYSGLSRETFNRILRDLVDEGHIEKLKSKSIVIKNFSRFKMIFGPFF